MSHSFVESFFDSDCPLIGHFKTLNHGFKCSQNLGCQSCNDTEFVEAMTLRPELLNPVLSFLMRLQLLQVRYYVFAVYLKVIGESFRTVTIRKLSGTVWDSGDIGKTEHT